MPKKYILTWRIRNIEKEGDDKKKFQPKNKIRD